MLYNYFIPLIHLGPPKNYTYYQEIPMEYIKKLIVGKNAEININRTFLNKKLLFWKKMKYLSLKIIDLLMIK